MAIGIQDQYDAAIKKLTYELNMTDFMYDPYPKNKASEMRARRIRRCCFVLYGINSCVYAFDTMHIPIDCSNKELKERMLYRHHTYPWSPR